MTGDGRSDGWAAGEFLTGGIKVDSGAVVVDGSLNMRESTNKNATIVGVLQTGDIVSVLDGPISSGGIIWFEVEAEVDSGPATGFVAGRYLGPV